jgi:hypothetical protein
MTLPTTNLVKAKMDLVVKNRKAELYMDEVRKDYYDPLCKDFNECLRQIKKASRIRKYPWYIHIYATFMLLFKNPFALYVLVVHGKKMLVESYWGLKGLIKDCELEFEATEKSIQKSKEIINNIQKAIDDKVE